MENFVGLVEAAARFIAIAVCLVVTLFSTIACGADKMERLYHANEATVLKPQVFEATGGLFGTNLFGGFTNVSLFPVPHANSVGTTQMGSAITEISFPGKRISFDRHFKNAVANMDVSEVFPRRGAVFCRSSWSG